MPTRHQRIPVTNDDELREALDRAAPFVAPGTRTATLVHDLAIEGARSVAADRERRASALRRLAERLGRAQPPWDPEVLAHVDELAWRHLDRDR